MKPLKPFNITREEFPDAAEWFGRFLDLINPPLSEITAAFSQGLTRRENMVSFQATLTFQTDSQPTPLKNQLTGGAPAREVRSTGKLSPDPGNSAWSLTWYEDAGGIQVLVQGLPVDATQRTIELIVE